MKTILCFGDSLTWGHDAAGQCRHPFDDRWPNALQAALGGGVHVIAEGLGGRTTAFDDYTAAEDRNGARVLPTLLGSHSPLDLVIILLGTNDMKPAIHGDPIAAQRGVWRLVQIVRNHPYQMGATTPGVLLVSPPLMNRIDDPRLPGVYAASNQASRALASLYADLAQVEGCSFFDAATVATPSPVDGVHLDAENTRKIGQALAPLARRMLDL
ncbi:SGNH/GDSL hydrolase family protein [Mesorhizobium sp. BE184]|uniref:SGNH/GDSL hydrolase family protein n=1 Tax=Mesorhizobium sp. BE184 TaxID=2817714 RepID=UPI00285C965C|nr:SGNH/GDSL hydrolase family protein [Mesorhizobium sp. BE184]MDR7032620.1 lysophospholipase L1-like esterase [Mesorhizobium sp. BE184]